MPPFILWPITSPNENPNSPKPDPSFTPMQQPPPPLPRVRSRKSSKQVAPKRAPQRGLGVAQLERLRMEQAGAAGESELLAHQPRRVVLPHMMVGSYPTPAGSGLLTGTYPTPAGSGGLLTGTYPMEAMGPGGFMGRYLVPPAPEPPSTQMVVRPLLSPPVDPVRCYSDQCEFCVRKKRLFGESLAYENMDGANLSEMNLAATIAPAADLERGLMASMERRKVPVVERQTREYQFFPTYGVDRSELAFPMVRDTSTSAPSTSGYPSQPIDLSLKLSF